MNHRRTALTVEHVLYLALFALALALRLYRLGAHPLTDHEARSALVVDRLILGRAEPVGAPDSPAYLFFTFFSFLVFGAGDATARLAPALLGAGVIFIPALFRDRLGREAALLTSGLLAVSAGLLAASRSADGAVIALLGLGLGLGALRQCLMKASSAWLVAAAVALGVGSAVGTTFLTGAFVLTLTAVVVGWVNPDQGQALREAWAYLRARSAAFLVPFVLTALVVATLGLMYPRGVGAVAEAWAAWPAGFWPSASGRPPVIFPLFLLAYEPLILVFGIFGAVRAFRVGHSLGQALVWFTLIAFAWVVAYGGRTQFDVIWIVAPWSALAGWALTEIIADNWASAEWPVVAAQVGAVVALAAFAGLNVASYAELVRGNQADFFVAQTVFLGRTVSIPSWSQFGMAALAVALALLISYVLGMGLSWPSARLGLTLGASAALLAMSLGAAWGLTQARANSPAELWWERPAADGLRRLMATLGNVSNYSVGNEHDVRVIVHAPADGALGWALRDFPHASFVDRLDPLVTNAVVITPAEEQNPTLGSAYVGQEFVLRSAWTPSLSLPEWVGWLAFRRAPEIQSERIILWVRQDVQQLEGTGQ